MIRLEVQQIVEVLGELKVADRSDSTDSEEERQCGANIEDLWKYGDRANSQWHVPLEVVVQVGGVTSKMAEGATSTVAARISSTVADDVSSQVAEGVSSKVAEDVTSNVA